MRISEVKPRVEAETDLKPVDISLGVNFIKVVEMLGYGNVRLNNNIVKVEIEVISILFIGVANNDVDV